MAQCTAHRKTGTQCKNGAIPGGFVCRYHGGSAPQVKAKAKERLEALIDPAIDCLGSRLRSEDERISLNAADSILDRTGYKGIEKHQEVPYTAEDLETLENLTTEELQTYIALRRKVIQPKQDEEESVH